MKTILSQELASGKKEFFAQEKLLPSDMPHWVEGGNQWQEPNAAKENCQTALQERRKWNRREEIGRRVYQCVWMPNALSEVACAVAGKFSYMFISPSPPSTVESTALVNALCGLGVSVEITKGAHIYRRETLRVHRNYGPCGFKFP